MTYYAWFTRNFLSGSKLVFHAATWERTGVEEDGVWRHRTPCGLVVFEGNVQGVIMEAGLAGKIGRPCRRCYR